MIRIHVRRLYADRRLLICVLIAIAIGLLMAKPQVFTLAQLRAMELSDLQMRFHLPNADSVEAVVRWYAGAIHLPELAAGCSTAIIPAAVLGAYVVGSCLKRPVITELFAGTPRPRVAMGLILAVVLPGIAISLLVFAGSLLLYGRDCFAVLGAADTWRVLAPIIGWRMFFDLAAYCPVLILAFATREMYFSFCGGAMLAVLTTVLRLLQEELWWFPNYALRRLVLYHVSVPQMLWLLLPSLLLLVAVPIVALGVCSRMERS